ncbi:hypothetical protein EDB92DRAFT_1522990 [Lactarius akahatsu]|uniref:BTB domain-containing protein n=1 Tax=Lactarius akahatsu TaxID=416441 RepID=A0AAD4LRQ8_9AGAM|nr:hypothetical protein EDB92DRAFT_1522990 [Lactarius akahatsu]
MNFSNFVEIMSLQATKCTSCSTRQCTDKLRLFDCLERHVRGQIEQMHDELLSLFDGLGDATGPQPSCGQPRDFGAPFDRRDSDVTIRSCDRVDFQVHKAVLGIASAAFQDMFTAPEPSPYGQGQVKQVIDLTEDSKTLHRLLSMIYPMNPIVPDTLEDALSLLSACQKYQMDSTATRVRALICARTPPLFTSENCFRAYGIASRCHLEEEALLSARLTLECPLTFEACGEDLRFISGADLFQLFGYRNECIKVAEDCIEKTNHWLSPVLSTGSTGLGYIVDRATEERLPVSKWWRRHFLRRIALRPSPKTITDRLASKNALSWHRYKSACTSCRRPDKTGIGDTICAALEAKLSAVIEQVRLDVRT